MNILDESFAIKKYMVEQRNYFHAHPELGLHEFETTRKIREKLEAHGVLCVPSSLATGLTASETPDEAGRETDLNGEKVTIRLEKE